MPRRLEIIAGGQTGVDRGALDAALELGASCGGWCPEGRMAEDGVIPERYPLEVLAGAGYSDRTRKNVEDSDGTLIVHFGPLSAGTLFTLEVCEELLRPVCLVDGDEEDSADAAVRVDAFIEENDIRRMNVAGPRASHAARAHDYACDVVGRVLITRMQDDGGTDPAPMKSG